MKTIKTACALIFIALAASAAFADAAENHRSISVAYSGKMEPLLYEDASGGPKGVYVDIMDEIAAICRFDVEYVRFERQSHAVRALLNGEVNAVLGCLENDYSAHPSLRPSPEIYSASICLVTRKEDLPAVLTSPAGAPLTAAYEMGTVSYSQATQVSAKSIRIVGTQEQLFQTLISGGSDVIIASRDCAQYLLNGSESGSDYTIALNYMTSASYSILLDRSDTLLYNAVSSAINRLRSSPDYDGIIDRWIIDIDLRDAQYRIKKLTGILGMVLAMALVVFAAIMAFNSRLRKLVEEKTADLKEKVDDLENAYIVRNKLIEHAYAANIVVKVDGTVLLMNEVARRMAGIAPGAEDIPNIETMKIIGKAWDLSPAEMEQPELLVLRDDDGIRRTYRYQCHRTSIQDERVFIVEDVTKEENDKQELFEESKNKALNRIIAGIAHEIKNPLTTIRAYASMAKEQSSDAEFMESFSRFVPKEVDRINSMIDTLRNYSRPPKGQQERFCVANVVNDCLGLAYISAKKNISVTQELDGSVYIRSAREHFRQVLINLIMNSMESIESKMAAGVYKEVPEVRISVYREGGSAVTEVYDNGLGMTEEQIQQCTDPFFTTKPAGTGMGLAVAKIYLKENGGRLDVESVPGEFTAMKLIFKEDISGDETETMDN